MRAFKTALCAAAPSKAACFIRKTFGQTGRVGQHFPSGNGQSGSKQIDGMGGTVSSNNKIIIVWKSEEPGIDVDIW
ncbi:MAG: hypothetical protein ACLTF6_01335 [Clostridium sp.]